MFIYTKHSEKYATIACQIVSIPWYYMVLYVFTILFIGDACFLGSSLYGIPRFRVTILFRMPLLALSFDISSYAVLI